uniref:Uncharacterized protein n=1 Tax=Bubo bubo TaxID=30461 RepID=A0A8C0FUH3_BUBBB
IPLRVSCLSALQQPASFLSGNGGAEGWDRVRDSSASGSAAPSVTGLYRAPSRVEQEASARVSAIYPIPHKKHQPPPPPPLFFPT